jgi:thiosulfate reductase cytochrome b subunit
MEPNKLYLYPKWLRAWHGVNAICIIMLIATGISMQYSDPNYPFIPFGTAILLHNIFGIIAIISYTLFLLGNLFTSNGKQYIIRTKGLVKRLVKQSQYYLTGYFKDEPKPFPISKERKFNPLQSVAYTSAMYVLMPIVIITGIALLFPEFIISEVFNTSGILLTAILHASAGFFISLFLIIHLYVASVGKHPLRNYKSMIDGYHETH